MTAEAKPAGRRHRQGQHQRSEEKMMAKTLYRPIATVFLILFALGLISSFSWVFFLLLSVVLFFHIGGALRPQQCLAE